MILTESRAKLRRAKEHFDTLERHVTAFLESHPYRVVVDQTANEIYVLRVDDAPTLPEDWSLIIGDCVHNLRAALDYIAWRLAGANPGDTETQFPIFITEPGWRTKGQRRVKRMLPAAQAVIHKGQPYHSHDPESTALNGIRVLDDADKHKLLTVVAAMPSHFSVTWATPVDPSGQPRLLVNMVPNPILIADAILGRLVIPNADHRLPMETYLKPEIAFGGELFSSRTHVLGSLAAQIREVDSIIGIFETHPEWYR